METTILITAATLQFVVTLYILHSRRSARERAARVRKALKLYVNGKAFERAEVAR